MFTEYSTQVERLLSPPLSNLFADSGVSQAHTTISRA